MVKRRRDKRIKYVVLGVFVAVFLFTFLIRQNKVTEESAKAANLAEFDPGYIISDWQMSNYNSMDELQIQAFLKSMNSCDDINIGRYTAGEKVSYFSEAFPPRTWHIKDGHFVCMADETFDGGTAAHIIYQAAQEYQINPQVLLVLLEKEQSLVRDTFPHSQQYRSATGYGCPDTAACSSKYYGLKNQIINAAALFRTVLDGGWTNYPLGNNYVQYNPNAACGGSIINIRNLATSALYRYTPYQPNAVTLAGGSDSCSAYGNMNFYSFFVDWFGDPIAVQSSVRVPDGVYHIQSGSGKKMVVDVEDGNIQDGANIQLYDNDGTGAQEWIITYNTDTDDYNIINSTSLKALDVTGGSLESGANIQLWSSNHSCAQRWKLISVGKDELKIASSCSGKVMDVTGGKFVNGSNLQIWKDNNTVAQRWKIMPVNIVSDGVYIISSGINMQKSIDIAGGIKTVTKGTNVQLWNRNGTAAQRWYIKRDSDGYYSITNLQSNKRIDLVGGQEENGTNIQMWNKNDSCAQKWRILDDGEKFVLISACSQKVIDLYGANTANGTNIQLYTSNNTDAQRWYLQPVKIIEEKDYTIVSGLSNKKVLDLAGNIDMNGTNIQIYNSNQTLAQKWRFVYDETTDSYEIINSGNDKVLDVEGAKKNNGANVQLWRRNNTCAQRWIVADMSDGYLLFSLCSDLVLEVESGKTANGTNVQLFQRNGTDAQKWVLQ